MMCKFLGRLKQLLFVCVVFFSQKKKVNQLYDYWKLFLFHAQRGIVMYAVQMSVIFSQSGCAQTVF